MASGRFYNLRSDGSIQRVGIMSFGMNEKNQLTSDNSHYPSRLFMNPFFVHVTCHRSHMTRNLNLPQSADPLKLLFVDQDLQYPAPAATVGDPDLSLGYLKFHLI
jgi:hypothetical protein